MSVMETKKGKDRSKIKFKGSCVNEIISGTGIHCGCEFTFTISDLGSDKTIYKNNDGTVYKSETKQEFGLWCPSCGKRTYVDLSNPVAVIDSPGHDDRMHRSSKYA